MAKRRTRSPHPGVVLIPPDEAGRHPTWRARFADPDTGKLTKVRLDPTILSTAGARRDWAIRKSRALLKRKIDLEAGAPRAQGTALADAVDRYFEDHPHLRASTLALYRQHAEQFVQWATGKGLKKADDLTRETLVAFRASRLRIKLRTSVAGGRKGEKFTTDEMRKPNTINVELRSVRAVIGYLRELGLVARLSSDDLRDGLKRLDVPTERLEYLRPADLRKLLVAALRHDSDTFALTREEIAGVRPAGTTPRYPAIAPFVATLLLSGMRLDEAVTLQWSQVDLDAVDHNGKRVGEIQLTTRTKTRKPREIGLEVSPLLRKLLAAMRRARRGPAVFELGRDAATTAMERLARYGAPKFSAQVLRQTCGTYLTNAPGIYGAASAYHSARQLGHSVAVAERHYVGRARGIPLEAKTLEAAMQVERELGLVVKAVRARAGGRVDVARAAE